MIRVRVRASSAVARAGLESLLQNHPSLRVLRDLLEEQGDGEGMDGHDPEADVLVVEVDSCEDALTQEALRTAANGLPVVLLVPGTAAEWADVLRRGVRAILPANATGPQIAAATEAAANGLVVLDPSEVLTLLPAIVPAEVPAALPEVLTAREIQVLRLLADGLSNKEIAAKLTISEHTIKFHVASIMGKLGATSRTEAVTLGIRHGIVLI